MADAYGTLSLVVFCQDVYMSQFILKMRKCTVHIPFYLWNRAATPNLGGRPYGRGQQGRMAGGKSPSSKQGGKQAEHTHVTLEDVKGITEK